jgi:hypothetical protein
LGGHLPYNELAWMTNAERRQYNSITDQIDRSIFADQCLKQKIAKGKVLNLASLPPWVPDCLKRIIRKATHICPEHRFLNATAFKAKLHKVRPSIYNWFLEDGVPTLLSSTSYRVVIDGDNLKVQKRKLGAWRNDKTIQSADLKTIVNDIQKKA